MALSSAFPATTEALDIQVVADQKADSPGGTTITADELAGLQSGAEAMAEAELRSKIERAEERGDSATRDVLIDYANDFPAKARMLVDEAIARHPAPGLQPPKETWAHWFLRKTVGTP